MSLTVLRLSAEHAALGWEKAGHFLLPAIKLTRGLYEPQDVLGYVSHPYSGWTLWVAHDEKEALGAWTTEIRHYPRCKSLEITFAGGRDMARFYDLGLQALECYARERGCDRLRCYGRRGWGDMGFRTIGYLHERILP